MTHQTLKQHNTNSFRMRKAIFICLVLSGTLSASAQRPGTAPVKAVAVDTNKLDIREKLVQLALQNPQYEIMDRKIAISAHQLAKAKSSWLNTVQISGNLNEYTIKTFGSSSGAETNTFFPRYNIAVTLPLDLFTQKARDVKIARETLSTSEAEKNQKFRELRAEVLIKYEDYLMHKQKLEFQSQLTQDAYTVFLQGEKDFSDNIIKQEDYNKFYKSYTEELTKKSELQRNFNVSKIELEKVIGVPLDNVLANTK